MYENAQLMEMVAQLELELAQAKTEIVSQSIMIHHLERKVIQEGRRNRT